MQAWIAQTTLAAALQQAATVAAVPTAPPLQQQAQHRAWRQQHAPPAEQESMQPSPAVVAPKALRPISTAWAGSPALPSPVSTRPATPVAPKLAIDLNRAPSASTPRLRTPTGPTDIASPSLPPSEAVDAAIPEGMEAAVAAAVEEVRAAAEEQATAASGSGSSEAEQAQASEVSTSCCASLSGNAWGSHAGFIDSACMLYLCHLFPRLRPLAFKHC